MSGDPGILLIHTTVGPQVAGAGTSRRKGALGGQHTLSERGTSAAQAASLLQSG